METSLPDLSFADYGKAELSPNGFHSSVKESRRTHPRTDLAALAPWTSFVDDVHQAIQLSAARANLPPSPFTVNAWRMTRFVECEENIRSHASYALHKPVEQVVHKLGVYGSFVLSEGIDVSFIGDPDFLWMTARGDSPQSHPKLVVSASTTSH